MLGVPPSSLKLRGYSLRELVSFATRTPSFDVVGGPAWTDTDRWDVQTENQTVLMMEHPKVLLATLKGQIGLRTHNDTRVMPVYELTVSSTGSKLVPSPDLDARGPHIRAGIGRPPSTNSPRSSALSSADQSSTTPDYQAPTSSPSTGPQARTNDHYPRPAGTSNQKTHAQKRARHPSRKRYKNNTA
jgi:uncharacterized protein (TIGR03435 family)